MSLPIEAAVPLFTLGWVAGVGTALVCRPARGARRAQLLRDTPPGWRSYAPVSRPRHANSDNGAPMTARPPIEPQGQAQVRPEPRESNGICDCGNPPNLSAPGKPLFPAPRQIRNDFGLDGHANSDNGGPTTAKPPIEPQGQALVKPKPPGGRQVWADGTPVTPRPPLEPQEWMARDPLPPPANP